MLRKAAPLNLEKTGMLSVLSVGALGAFGTQFICTIDSPLHFLLWHFIPVLIIGLLGVFLGKLFLKNHLNPELENNE